jgi:hypothetical protein
MERSVGASCWVCTHRIRAIPNGLSLVIHLIRLICLISASPAPNKQSTPFKERNQFNKDPWPDLRTQDELEVNETSSPLPTGCILRRRYALQRCSVCLAKTLQIGGEDAPTELHSGT